MNTISMNHTPEPDSQAIGRKDFDPCPVHDMTASHGTAKAPAKENAPAKAKKGGNK